MERFQRSLPPNQGLKRCKSSDSDMSPVYSPIWLVQKTDESGKMKMDYHQPSHAAIPIAVIVADVVLSLYSINTSPSECESLLIE